MTDAEWTACDNSERMLEFLRGQVNGRKIRLFGCACCRRIWRRLTDERSRKAVEAAELYADGFIAHADLKQAWAEASGAIQGSLVTHSGQSIATVAARSAADPARASIAEAVALAARAGVYSQQHFEAEKAAQAAFLRDLLGNPFRPANIDLSWLAWNDGAIPKMAQSIYDGRSFDLLPLLADALEDAGCTDAAILGHCRGGGIHVRGCWVVDLLLGKE